MKFILFIFVCSLSNAFALDAVITVLETPLLKSKSYDAPVVQYLRKGDVIKIHPSVNNNTDYDHLAPSPAKYAKLKKDMDESPEWNQDPLFKGEATTASIDDEFIPTLDRQGNTVYVIRDHLYVYFTKPKELDQVILKKDPTDYRLEEPLPKKYPLYSLSGYRGQVTLGVTQPYYESYPYPSNVKNKGYTSPIDLNMSYLRKTPDDQYDRYFFGGTLNLRTFSNSYTLFNGNSTKEQGLKLGIGPYITYDAYKGIYNRVNLYGSINLYLFNQLNIAQKNEDLEEQRNYRAITISPRIGVQYHRKQILEDVDFVLGTSIEMEPATTFRSTSAANQQSWWVSRGNDKFKTRTTFTLGGYLGFQSAY
ncbi:MAG: hypothetical protein H0V66_09090 [Bdellovibrionales bacterium]|nr:hypothetical protein [Bdellovibrionales bacterium]